TACAGLGTSSALGSGARTGLANDRGWNIDLGGFALERLLKRDFHVVAQVRAAFAGRAASATRAAHSEEIIKNVGKGRCKIGSESRRSGARALFKSGVAEAIIGRAFIDILKNVIGLVDLFEPMLAFLVAWIAIRMVLHRELAKRCLE